MVGPNFYHDFSSLSLLSLLLIQGRDSLLCPYVSIKYAYKCFAGDSCSPFPCQSILDLQTSMEQTPLLSRRPSSEEKRTWRVFLQESTWLLENSRTTTLAYFLQLSLQLSPILCLGHLVSKMVGVVRFHRLR